MIKCIKIELLSVWTCEYHSEENLPGQLWEDARYGGISFAVLGLWDLGGISSCSITQPILTYTHTHSSCDMGITP